jgi:hypothetical protein
MASGAVVTSQRELRVYLLLEDLQAQFAALMGKSTRGRGYPPLAGQTALIIEIAPALMIERVIDLGLKAAPAVEPGILFVERQFGVLEIHAHSRADVVDAGEAIVSGLGLSPESRVAARMLYMDVIEDVADIHAVIMNRSRHGSMVLPGEALLVMEVTPALYAAAAANQAERVAPHLTLVDVQMIGATGRVYVSGDPAGVRVAAEAMEDLLAHAGRGSEG